MKRISPCKDCTDRWSECHSSCERYISWKSEFEEEKERLLEAKTKDNEYMTYRKIVKDKKLHAKTRTSHKSGGYVEG